ncbi:hypothetical protein GRI75_10535 [Altererythrobacter soli]|uniref:HPt domain-containing protein n=1 Tax=Croceibacterium soli TaxID=1739690 RepID=A0A6I4UU85_9SPHN|nr:Hpt domain-containing protein [Croceibacterium soli]MXP42076.1 hypothetical protein [Croceibacterium soli]
MTDYDQKMSELRARFRERLAGELEDLCRFSAATASPHDLASLRDKVHRLAGLSGTMGYPEISAIAKRLDEALGGTPEADQIDQLTATLSDAIRSVVER